MQDGYYSAVVPHLQTSKNGFLELDAIDKPNVCIEEVGVRNINYGKQKKKYKDYGNQDFFPTAEDFWWYWAAPSPSYK